MSDFKTRLVTEKSELEEKLNKLDAFLMSEKVNSVDDVQKALLQATAMNTHLQCLKDTLYTPPILLLFSTIFTQFFDCSYDVNSCKTGSGENNG